MYLSAERLALANQTVLETFEQSCVAWQAIPQWDTGDPGQTYVQSDDVSGYVVPPPTDPPATPVPGPLGGAPIEVKAYHASFYVTLAQAIAPNPDALLAAVIARTVLVAKQVDAALVTKLVAYSYPKPQQIPLPENANDLVNGLIDARARAELFGYRAPSCLFTDTNGLKALSRFISGYSILRGLLEASSVNSLYRVEEIQVPDGLGILDDIVIDGLKFVGGPGGVVGAIEKAINEVIGAGGVGGSGGVVGGGGKGGKGKAAKAKGAKAEGDDDDADEVPSSEEDSDDYGRIILLGRRQLIAQAGAASASPGEEPVDLAVSIPPSLEIIGERADGSIELAVRTRLAIRVKDRHGVIGVDTP